MGTRRLAFDLRCLRLLRPASAVRDHRHRRPGRVRPAGTAPGPRSAARGRVAHALLRVLTPSPIALARGTPRRPLSSPPSLHRSGAESLNARAIERSVLATGLRRGRRQSPRLRTTARTQVVPLFVLGHCNAAPPTIDTSGLGGRVHDGLHFVQNLSALFDVCSGKCASLRRIRTDRIVEVREFLKCRQIRLV